MPTTHQTECVEDVPYLPASDGLLARKSGFWAKRKHRFTLFSRHPLAEKFWNEILKIDETGQRELRF